MSEVTVGSMINIPCHLLDADDYDRIADFLTIGNPEYESAKKHTKGGARFIGKTITFLQVGKNDKGVPCYSIPRNFFKNTLFRGLRHYLDGVDYFDVELGKYPVSSFSWVGILRNYQSLFFKQNDVVNTDDAVWEIPTAHGKTVLATYVMSLRKVKTIVVVPVMYLAHQWLERCKTFLPTTSAIIAESKFEEKGFIKNDILIITYDLLSSREFSQNFYDTWGQIIIDEAHMVGAQTYEPILRKVPAKFRIALSATFRRSDDMIKILIAHFGTVFTMANQFPPTIILPVWFRHTPKLTEKDFSNRKVFSFTLMDSYLAKCEQRNEFIKKVIETCLAKGRRFIFISKRKDALKDMYEWAQREFPVFKHVLVIGETNSKETTKMVEEADAVYGITQITRMGLDADSLDTLILHNPTSDIEQPIGRVNRLKPGKKQSLVIYVVDDFRPCEAIYNKSLKTATNVKVLPFTDGTRIFAKISELS